MPADPDDTEARVARIEARIERTERGMWGDEGLYKGVVHNLGVLVGMVRKVDRKLDSRGATLDDKLTALENKMDRLKEARDERERARVEREAEAEKDRALQEKARDRRVTLIVGFVPVICIIVTAIVTALVT